MSTNLTDFYDYVMPDVPGCLPDIALQKIRLAVIEFCQRTHFWHQALTPINVVAGTAEYALTPPADTEINKCLQANYRRDPTAANSGQELVKKSISELEKLYHHWPTEERDEPIYFTQMERASIILVPIPQISVTNGLETIVSLKPDLAATSLANDEIFDHYAEQIARGAIYRLQMIPKKPYTDKEMAVANKRLFDDFIATTADKVNRSFLDINISYEPLV